MFLSPHQILPGGIKGIAILLSHITEMKLGLILLFINLPFVIFRRRNVKQTMTALVALIVTMLFTLLLYPTQPLVSEPLLASIIGGVIFGSGIGLIVRYGWYVDGVNDVAVYLKKTIRLSIGEILMIINLTILACGGLYFGWDQAIHSVIAYYTAYKAIQFTLEYRSRKMVWVHSEVREKLANALRQEFGQDIAFLTHASQHGTELFFTISHHNIKKLNAMIQDVDQSANMKVSYTSSASSDPYYKI